ncbi:hypothetical protein CBS101457_006768 [Exobasidium rhododendri]|nr:hypothetical protein CBS101457_006768 [Exobasidium rhododendri]
MATGAIACAIWARKYPKNADMYAYALAAGFVAGEGIGGVINAILQIANVSGAQLGSRVGLAEYM